MDCSLPGYSVHGDSLDKKTGVGCRALLQGIFPTQGSNPHLLRILHWQAGSLPLAPPGKSNTSLQIDGEIMETVTDFIFLGSKSTTDAEWGHEIKIRLLLGEKLRQT